MSDTKTVVRDVEYDGHTWPVNLNVFMSPEFHGLLDELAEYAEELEDEDEAKFAEVAADVGMLVSRIMRRLLGREQGRRFLSRPGARTELDVYVQQFFETAAAAVKQPDPSAGLDSSASTSEPSKPTSDASTD